jgi:murein DD-endopeptidase MepM/ murein hydrolase activator NlpD
MVSDIKRPLKMIRFRIHPKLKIFLLLISVLIIPETSFSSPPGIPFLKELNPVKSKVLKSIRKDIRRSIFTVKSRRPAETMPDLKFYRYRVRKGETFWIILSRTSLDMDTLISVNSLSTPGDIRPGKIIFIPNMRGIIIDPTKGETINKIIKRSRVTREYVSRVNRSEDLSKKYLFIPCGKLSSLQRSLFLGTGFMYPLKGGRRTSGFGMRRNPFNRRKFQFHTGVDLACKINTGVYAARSGKVLFTGYKGGYGKLVIIGHEHGYRSYYGHLNRIKVKTGSSIKRGEMIALSGNTGRTTGPHLHFEIRKSGQPINPGILVRGR